MIPSSSFDADAFPSMTFIEARTMPLMFQSHFLTAMELTSRVQALVGGSTDPERKKTIESAAKRLIDPTGMGGQYKVLAFENRGEARSMEVKEEEEEEEPQVVKEEDRVWPFDYKQELLGGGG